MGQNNVTLCDRNTSLYLIAAAARQPSGARFKYLGQLAIATAFGLSGGAAFALPDHHELEATLLATPMADGIALQVAAAFPGAPSGTRAYWSVVIRNPADKTVGELSGELQLDVAQLTRQQDSWSGADLPAGFYSAELRATAIEPWMQARIRADSVESRVNMALRFAPNGVVVQRWDVPIGAIAAPQMPEFAGLPLAKQRAIDPPGGLPYRIYLANLHSQTNHSDGGGNIATCTSSQGAQNGEFGPADAYAYAMDKGLDVLFTSEHNHYFDGSSGTNSSATPAQANGLYQSGVQAALAHNLANPNFLALYGMEWGVISGGGHLNILGADFLYGWEYNASSQLLAEVFTAKSNYAALYPVLRQNNLIGQFNHPASSGQFVIDGTALAYHPDGDEVMALAEILNTSAFSNNITETETSRTSYESTFNRILERGFHVAPTTNQDNHCANWGMSYTNRTGVLLPSSATLTPTTFLEALRARRIYATMDRSSQVIFTANGQLMGSRLRNHGPLALQVLFASSTGDTVSRVQIQEGVPGRNGTVSTLIESATHSFTPTLGLHFYYAKLTQGDGNLLWSAPIWVEQVAPPGPLLVDGFE